VVNKIISVLLSLVLVIPAVSGDNAGFAGSYLRMGLGARAIAMGNTGVASAVSAYSTFYNPATLGEIEGRLGGLSYSFMSLDRRFGYISLAIKVPPAAGASIGWIESGVGDLRSYNSIGQETGDINHSANAIYFAFGRSIVDRVYFGVAVKILFERINDGTDEFDYSSNGVGFDFGLIYAVNDNLRIGYQIRDIKSQLKANTDKIFEQGGTTIDPFPILNRLGIAYISPLSWLRAAYDFEWSNHSEIHHHIGLEALRGKNLALRIGYNGSVMTFGAGMDFMILNIESYLDYAFLPSTVDEGGSHIFSWQLAF
jgi:hypothetical protein